MVACPLLAESGPYFQLISDDLNVRFGEKRTFCLYGPCPNCKLVAIRRQSIACFFCSCGSILALLVIRQAPFFDRLYTGVDSMNDELNETLGSKSAADLKSVLINSLLGTIGVMWTIGGILAILNLYDVNWILGWLSAFIWIWGCWAAALYFDVKRFFS